MRRILRIATLLALLPLTACGPLVGGKPAAGPGQADAQGQAGAQAPRTAAQAPMPVPRAPVLPTARAAPVAGARQQALMPVTLHVPPQFRSGQLTQDRTTYLPPDFAISVYVAGLGSVRSLVVSPGNDLLATIPSQGRIVALRDLNQDGVADGIEDVATGLTCPYGMVFFEGYLYVAQTTQITRHAYAEGEVAVGPPEVVVDGLPPAGCAPHHFRPLAIDANRMLYTAFGSTCNVCVEQDPRRGQVWQFPVDGGEGRAFATGLRNVVDLTIDPTTGELWGVVNERDQLGDNVPPDMVTIIHDSANYGWPYCYQTEAGGWAVDTRVPRGNPACEGLTPPTVPIQAHSAPLGLASYAAEQFPAEYHGNVFVGLHGSWNRSEGTGFKVIRILFADGQPQPPQDFATGWLIGPRGPNDAWGRPVAVAVAPDGSLFVSDDRAGAVYRIAYEAGA